MRSHLKRETLKQDISYSSSFASQQSCFYLLLLCTQVVPLACLCRNAIAPFHICISGCPRVITWIFLQIQYLIILYKLYWLDCICVCRLPMVMCRTNTVLCLQNLVLSTYNIQMSGHNCQIARQIDSYESVAFFIHFHQAYCVSFVNLCMC